MNLFLRHPVMRPLQLVVALCALLLIVNSCSEVTQPEETVQSKFTVLTELRHDTTGGATTVLPLPNVRVTVRRVDGQATDPKLTDTRGEAVLFNTASIAGDDFVVEAFSPVYGTRIDTVHGVCGDARVRFVFRETNAAELNCNTLAAGTLQLLFTDVNTGSDKLIRNAPNPVQNCLPVARNTGRDNMTVQVGTGSVGVFTVTALQIDGQVVPITGNPMSVLLPPGSVLGMCFDVNTSQTSEGRPNGRFDETLSLRVTCEGGPTADLSLALQATVVEQSCDCSLIIPGSTQTLRLAEPVEVGLADTLSGTIFTNTGPCAVLVRVNSVTPSTGRNDWSIIAPAALRNAGGEVRLAPGESLTVDAAFRPQRATTISTPSELTLDLEILPEGDPATCALTVVCSGESCDETCPTLRVNGRDYPFGTTPAPRDSLYIRTDKRVFISDEEPSTVTEGYDFVLTSSDSLICRTNDIVLRVVPPTGDQFSARYFEISDTRIALNTGTRIAGSFEMTFTAPTKDELRQILLARNPGGPPRTADSMFTVRVIMEVSGCPTQELLVDAIVTTLPDFTPPIKMHAYRQTTTRQPRPEYEYYVFGESAVRSLRNENTPPPNGPETGDLWVDVPNPNGALPQQPFIKNEGNIPWALWQNITDESFFNNILQIVQQVQAGVDNGTFSFNTGDITTGPPGNLAVGNVYVFQFSPTRYGVMVIREINNGTENNLNNQSAIHFRVLYPVLID